MAGFASGKRSWAISDRSGLRFPYTEMVREWNGFLVHTSEYEPKQPQLEPKTGRFGPTSFMESKTTTCGSSKFNFIRLPIHLRPINYLGTTYVNVYSRRSSKISGRYC